MGYPTLHRPEPSGAADVAPPTRRQFLRVGVAAGGGLLASFVLPGFVAGVRAQERRRDEPPPEAAVGRAASAASADAPGFAPNGFIRIDRAGQVYFVIHKVEMGQGTFTSLPMLMAEELEVDPAKVRLVQAPPDNKLYSDPLVGGQVTGGSTSVRGAWEPLRRAGATVRTMLVSAAAQTWDVDASTCRAQDGAVVHLPSGRTLHYGELVDRAAKLPVPQDVGLKDPKDFRLIGKPVRRLDSAEKVDGRAQFGIDVRLPGMGVATVAASPVVGGKLKDVAEAAAKAVKGVRQVVRLDNAVAVVGDHMRAARQGLAAANPTWSDGPHADFSLAGLVAQMDAASRKPGAVARHDGDAAEVLASSGVKKLEAVYQLPFLAHATMEPMNCTVEVRPDGCDVWVGSQVPTFAQAAAANLLYSIPNIQVEYVRHEPPVPTAFWRGVGATHSVFVVESFMDELAALAGQDPFEYRRALLDKSPRAKAVLELAAKQAGWGTPVRAPAGRRAGRGLSVQFVFGSFMAQVAEVAVNDKGEVSVTRVVCAVDCGQVVNPGTVRAQIEGGVVFGITAALWGEITFENGRAQQSNFHDYRVMRINEAPRVEVHIVPSTESPGGLGEPGTAAIAPAVTNAVYAATGKRVRKLPISAEALRAA